MTLAAIARHMQLVRELSKPGGVLTDTAATATINNPAWWVDGEPTPARDRLHQRLIAAVRASAPNVAQDRKAIVLAGPPGAGKSTVLRQVLDLRGDYLIIDADEFKRLLLQDAIADGSYEGWIVPVDIRELTEAGERFFPLELASLVHQESAYLAQALRDDAIVSGENIVIDTVLGKEQVAIALGVALTAAGYDIEVINVEVPYEVSEARIQARWEEAYSIALNGGDSLGGRWVPSEYARDMFSGPGGRSRPEVAAEKLAQQTPNVLRFRVFRTTAEQARTSPGNPTASTDLSRSATGTELLETVLRP